MTEAEYVATVTVATATAIVASKTDPYRILVADSAKHPKPVMPGGKMEQQDAANGLEQAGLLCITRELEEEIGTLPENIRYVGMATDPARDVRVVPCSKLENCVTSPALPQGISPDAKIRASYGTPDYIYAATVDETAIRPTEELSAPRFIDIRTLKPGDLSAGHDVVALTYRKMLDQKQEKFPDGSLRDFARDRNEFQAVTPKSGGLKNSIRNRRGT
jgi:8-oxo-dGTP pyrophosphatase MutT (NUDIX family)